MKLKIIVTIAITAAALVSFGALSSCGGGNGNLKISVQDSAYNALWGAKVVSESQPSGQLKIDGITEQEKGGVIFNNIKAGTYEIQVSRYDYAPTTLNVTVKSGQTQNITVILYYSSPPPPVPTT